MAFSIGNTGGGTFGSSGFASLSSNTGGMQAQSGPDLEEIQTEGLGFHALAGDSKVQLFPTAWPDDALPHPTSSLLAVASKKGLLAAAGPSSVIVASTESVRQAFSADGGSFKPCTPQLTIEFGTRISQVAISSDESVLVLSAEAGGGFAIYSIDNLMQGNKDPASEISTDGASVRSLVPNPAAEHAELFAVVTFNGQLLAANMKESQFVGGANGKVLKDGVSSVSWSNKGKQLTAGLGNGAAVQMKPDGQVVKEIPRPPGLEGDQHVSAISWLENDLLIIAHTPSNDDGSGMAPATNYHLVTRDKDSGNCLFQRLPEVCGPFGLNRSPPFQFIQRLREFPPDLKDMVIIASTASEEIGVFTRATRTLASDSDPGRLTNVFTATSMANDSRRAQLPMSEDMTANTSPIGMALDLSSKTNVHRPLPGEEIDESQGPLPGLLILNNLGVLSAWWIAYATSIRNGTHYPGLAMYAGQQQPQIQSHSQVSAPISAFGQSALGLNSLGSTGPSPAFGTPSKPVASAFGATSSLGAATPAFGSTGSLGTATPAFGNASALGGAKPAFGSASGLGNRASPWGSSTPQQSSGASFGQPAFGSTSGIGQKSSPWASSSTSTAFGQTSTLGTQSSTFGSQTPQSTFGSASTPAAGAGGGFASFANSGGFAAAAAKSGGGSFLQQSTPNKLFGSEMDTGSAFTPTPKKDENPAGSIFGLGPSGFKLESAWKNENAGKDVEPKPATQTSNSLFGGDFGKALGDASAQPSVAPSTEADMSDMSDGGVKETSRGANQESPKELAHETTTPADTPAPAKFTAPVNSGLFGTQSQNQTTPAAEVAKSAPAPSIFGGPTGQPLSESTPFIKKEPLEEDDKLPEASKTPNQPPVPPDTTSKATYTPGTSSATSTASASKQSGEEAPLPPDFLGLSSKTKATAPPEPSFSAREDVPLPPDSVKPKQEKTQPPPQTPTDAPPSFVSEKSQASSPEESSGELTALPDDHDDLDDEGSGVDVGKEINDEASPKITPESSFGGKHDTGGPFSKITQPQAQPAQKSLFGEVGKASMPVFPPPSKLQESPRSPSPVRPAVPTELLRPDNQRSVSAPDMAPPRTIPRRSIIEVRKPEKSFAERQKEEQERQAREKERQRLEEEQPLSDQEDDEIRKELAAPIEPTLEVGPFHAHEDYVGNVSKPGIPGQIEKLYRDINSMIDVLGLNSRKLQAFTTGHAELFKESGRDKDDLDSSAQAWTLVEIEDLSTIISTLTHELDSGRLRNVDSKTDDCVSISKDLSKLRARQTDLKRTVDSLTNPETLSTQRLTPLTAEQSIQRHDLRHSFSTFQTTLAKAEEAISILRARLAALPTSPSKQKSPKKVPTVEAVENTIRKMTAMAERKSGDIDVLETQMRRLGLGGRPDSAGSTSLLLSRSGAAHESPYNSSRASSPGNFVTPPTSARKSLRSSFINGNGNASARSNAPFFTPRSSRLGDSMMSSSYAGGSPAKSPRRKLSEISKEEAKVYAERMARRRDVKRAMRDALVSRGRVEIRALGME